MPSEATGDISPGEQRERRLKGNIRVGYIALAFWPFFLFAALMSGDAPGSEKRATTLAMWVFYAGVVPFVTHVAARIAFRCGQIKAANYIAMMPTVVIVVFFSGAVFWTIVMDLLLKSH